MVSLLDEFLIFSPNAKAKWDGLSDFQKQLVSFFFFASILPEHAGLTTRYPPISVRNRTITRLRVELSVGALALAICNDDIVVLDLQFNGLLTGTEAPSPN